MKIKNETDILEKGFRNKIIVEILGQENEHRKLMELRKHEVYRDMTRKWVVLGLLNEAFKKDTVARMENRATNISICRKIVNKLAQTYTGGVTRKVRDDNSQVSIDLLSIELDINTRLKKSDRYRQLFKNTTVQVVARPNTAASKQAETAKFDIAVKVLAPWEYDVIEDSFDNTKALCYVLTDFPERHNFGLDTLTGSQGIRTGVRIDLHTGDRRDQTIADSPADKNIDNRQFIWWSSMFHFTTDIQGNVIKAPNEDATTFEEQVANPIGILPFMDVHADQDGNYWAQGGEDLVETSILINKELTDVNYITFHQGFGQMVISAKDVPKRLVGGPDNAFVFQVEDGDPTPQVFFASSNPPIEAWMQTIKAQIAMLLSTNDLSTKLVSANLDASADMASGIAMLIEQAEVTASQQDVQQIFRDQEPLMWEIIRRWHGLLSENQSLIDNLQAIPVFEDSDVKLKFNQLKPVVSELDQLNVIEKRKALGLDTMKDLIMRDNPDISNEEAEKRINEIKEERVLINKGGVNGEVQETEAQEEKEGEES